MSEPIELIDLGDATKETRQFIAIPVFLDSVLDFGILPG
jgi:hypothetical protein